MSAWIVSKRHIDYMVLNAKILGAGRYLTFRGENIGNWNNDVIGTMLWNENIASVAHRYSDSAPDDLPGPIPTPRKDSYTFNQPLMPVDPVVLIKAIACYRYQSCEHPGWQDSEAQSFCDDLEYTAITALPGYEEAPWGID